jgi:endonuclease I
MEYKVSDLHNMYPSYTPINMRKNNAEYGEVSEVVESFEQVCINSDAKFGKIDDKFYFEPPSESKGNIARSMFYFSVRYNLPIDEVQEAFLKQWHEQDPVDELEIRRNEMIYKIQNVRNPFIDYPELVERIEDF